ncbi:MAG: metallophosphoesterase [Sulfurimonas sp.]
MKKISRRGFLKSALAMSAMPLIANEKKTKDTNSLKFIHITDSHMDIADENSIEAMKLMVEFVNTEYKDLDFVCFGGDNFNNNVPGKKDALLFKEIIDELHCPSLLVRGNKEAYPTPNDSIHLKEFQELFVNNRGLSVSGKDWAYEKNGYVLLGLDSCVEGANNGRYTDETIAFAKKFLDKGKPTMTLDHHPYLNYWGETKESLIHNYVLNNTDEVQKQLFSYDNLILTLSGHKHVDSVKEINKTKVIATRGFIRPLDLDMYPMRYVELNCNKISEKLIYTS